MLGGGRRVPAEGAGALEAPVAEDAAAVRGRVDDVDVAGAELGAGRDVV